MHNGLQTPSLAMAHSKGGQSLRHDLNCLTRCTGGAWTVGALSGVRARRRGGHVARAAAGCRRARAGSRKTDVLCLSAGLVSGPAAGSGGVAVTGRDGERPTPRRRCPFGRETATVSAHDAAAMVRAWADENVKNRKSEHANRATAPAVQPRARLGRPRRARAWARPAPGERRGRGRRAAAAAAAAARRGAAARGGGARAGVD